MEDVFIWILGAMLLNSLLGLVGIFSLWVRKKLLKKITFLLVAFAAGALIGGAFFHLLPESLEHLSGDNVFLCAVVGFIFFLMMEIYLHWHHCKECKIHPFTYLMLIGDGIHNFIDGLIVAASFFISIPLGIVTTIMIMGHELPQQLGIFGVLIYGGITRKKAFIFSYITQFTCVLGGIAGYLLSSEAQAISVFLIPFAAGGFIYIAASDLIPELHRTGGVKNISGLSAFFVGLLFMLGIKALIGG